MLLYVVRATINYLCVKIFAAISKGRTMRGGHLQNQAQSQFGNNAPALSTVNIIRSKFYPHHFLLLDYIAACLGYAIACLRSVIETFVVMVVTTTVSITGLQQTTV